MIARMTNLRKRDARVDATINGKAMKKGKTRDEMMSN